MAASSVFQRSSWKLDQLTPTTWANAPAAARPRDRAVNVFRNFILSPSSGGQSLAWGLGMKGPAWAIALLHRPFDVLSAINELIVSVFFCTGIRANPT